MRKIVIVLLTVISLVLSFSVSSFASYFGDGSGEDIPIPECEFFFPGTYFSYLTVSGAPFRLTSEVLEALLDEDGLVSYTELSTGVDGFRYFNESYEILTIDYVDYLSYRFNFSETSGGVISLPIMNYSDSPILYRVYSPNSDVVSVQVACAGYIIDGAELIEQNFSFDVSTDSDEYINSYIAQVSLYDEALSIYDYIQFDITAPIGSEWALLYPLNSDYSSIYHTVDLVDIDVEVIDAPNFLDWLTRSVSSFLNTKIFTIGSVNVTLGVCLLVPLSLYFLVAFLKKFAGG